MKAMVPAMWYTRMQWGRALISARGGQERFKSVSSPGHTLSFVPAREGRIIKGMCLPLPFKFNI